MNDLQQMLSDIERTKFYGSIEVKFEAGKAVLIKRSETFKPTSNSYGYNRGNHEQPNS